MPSAAAISNFARPIHHRPLLIAECGMVTVKVLLVPLVIAAGRVMTPLIAGRPPRVCRR
ncbi:hypothetical protein AB5I41_31520 [Sphingomonas sp. MMS24-JH45]